MKVLIDFNGLAMPAYFKIPGITKNLLMKYLLHKLAYFKNIFKTNDIIIVLEAGNNWRKDKFPYYKINRDKSNIDFELIQKCIKDLEAIGFCTFSDKKCEADDCIAVLAKHFGKTEEVVIVSGDKDFIQLIDKNIKLYSDKDYITVENTQQFLQDLILKGDVCDGIPNVLSPDETFYEKMRQIRFSKKTLKENVEEYPYFKRNQELIDFNYIPKEIQDSIIEKVSGITMFYSYTKNSIYKFFIKNKMGSLLETIHEDWS